MRTLTLKSIREDAITARRIRDGSITLKKLESQTIPELHHIRESLFAAARHHHRMVIFWSTLEVVLIFLFVFSVGSLFEDLL